MWQAQRVLRLRFREPRRFPAANRSNGGPIDVSVRSGRARLARIGGLAPVSVDVDDDSWIEVLVVNDSVPKCLYRNEHDGTFEDIGDLPKR